MTTDIHTAQVVFALLARGRPTLTDLDRALTATPEGLSTGRPLARCLWSRSFCSGPRPG